MVNRKSHSAGAPGLAAALLLTLLLPGMISASPASPDDVAPRIPQAAIDPPHIAISRVANSNSAHLAWQHVLGTDYYEIYRSTDPYPEINVAPTNQIYDKPAQAYGEGSPVDYDDDGVDRYPGDTTISTVQVIGDPQVNYFWIVQGRTDSADLSGPSNGVGEFDFAIVRGD